MLQCSFANYSVTSDLLCITKRVCNLNERDNTLYCTCVSDKCPYVDL